METERTFTAFAGERLIASGDVDTTIRKTMEQIDSGEPAPILIFEDRTGSAGRFRPPGHAGRGPGSARLPPPLCRGQARPPAEERAGPPQPGRGLQGGLASAAPLGVARRAIRRGVGRDTAAGRRGPEARRPQRAGARWPGTPRGSSCGSWGETSPGSRRPPARSTPGTTSA